MGRAKSNTKRRPKGKRGWRKIEVSSKLKPKIPLSIEEEKTRISKLRDSQLYYQDIKPRIRKRRTKKQLKASAKRKLLHRGFTINSTNANNILNEQIKSYNKKQRLFTWKQSQNASIHSNSPQKQTTTLKFKNKTRKKINLNNHKNIKSNKNNIKNNIDIHKNNPYNLYKIKHNNSNSKHLPIKDLWDNKKSNDNSSNSFNPQHIISDQLKASKAHSISGRCVPNKWVSHNNIISMPIPGESINPMQHQFYYLKWKAIQLKSKQIFKNKYQKQSTLKWYKNNLPTDVDTHTDQTIQKLKIKANEMKKLYLKHLRLWIGENMNDKCVNNNEINGFEREISYSDKMNDVKSNKKLKIIGKKMRVSSRIGHRIYGTKYRFRRRVTPSMKQSKLGKCLRNTLHTGTDHPLSFMFNEMQKQNKIHGHRRNRFIFPKKKGFLGPRYKVQTRIGKLHHANVGGKYFTGIDD